MFSLTMLKTLALECYREVKDLGMEGEVVFIRLVEGHPELTPDEIREVAAAVVGIEIGAGLEKDSEE